MTYQGTNLTVNTSGYSITTTSVNRTTLFSGTLALANSVAFTLTNNNTGGNLNSFGTISFGTGSSLNIQGGASVNNANRVALSAAGTTSGGSISLSGTGAGVTGFTSGVTIAAGGATLNSDITNNSSSSATMLGASSGNLLTYGGILSGTANLQISNGQSGGAGIVVLNNTNNYSGNTYLNAAISGVLRIGVTNALPTGTTVFFGQSSGGGTADFGGSIDLNGRDLAIGGLDSGSTVYGVSNNTSTLSILTIGKTSGSNIFGGIIGTVTNSNLSSQSNNIAIVKTGASTQILIGTNTYIGSTTVNDGVLSVTTLANGGSSSSIGASSSSAGNLILGGGTLRYTGSNTSTNRSFTLTNGSTSSIEVTSSSATVTMTGAAASTSGALTKLGSGRLTLSGTNAYSGATTISAGTLALSAAGSINDSSSIRVNGTGIYDVSAVSGYALSGTQTLSGTGTVNGSVTVGTGRTVQGGNSTDPNGKLTFNNNLTVGSGGFVGIRITNADTTGGLNSGNSSGGLVLTPNNNDINVLGVLDLTAGNFIIDGTGATFTHGSTYSYLIATGGTVIAVDITDIARFTFNNINTGGVEAVRLQNVGGSVYLNFTAVPEPGLMLGLAAGLLGLVGIVRKRLG